MRHLFLFIGADPNTDWLANSGLKLDERNFILTGPEARAGCLPLETSRPGVFAVGDVRAGSVKRVAASVGDGAQVVAALHTYLANAPALADGPGAMAAEAAEAALRAPRTRRQERHTGTCSTLQKSGQPLLRQ